MNNFVFIIAAFLFLAPPTFAQGSIEGTITDAKGAVVGRAVVSLIDAKGATVAQQPTDAEGYYTLDDIAAGTYKLVVNAGGFKPATKTNVLVVDDGLTVVELKLISNAVVTANPWPQPKFAFSVEYTVNGKTSKFNAQEVTGLENEANEIEYRHGNDKQFSTVKTPGLKAFADVTLKKGSFADDGKTLYEWYRSIRADANPIRGTIIIKLLDEDGDPTMVWTLKNAFPKKLTGINQATGSVETITIAHEGLSIVK
ncbi:MAG: phage tail protein [Pyrinomonadaceae bacterium]